jgi:hypothetical protein
MLEAFLLVAPHNLQRRRHQQSIGWSRETVTSGDKTALGGMWTCSEATNSVKCITPSADSGIT